MLEDGNIFMGMPHLLLSVFLMSNTEPSSTIITVSKPVLFGYVIHGSYLVICGKIYAINQ
jgi:hypothetical protein